MCKEREICGLHREAECQEGVERVAIRHDEVQLFQARERREYQQRSSGVAGARYRRRHCDGEVLALLRCGGKGLEIIWGEREGDCEGCEGRGVHGVGPGLCRLRYASQGELGEECEEGEEAVCGWEGGVVVVVVQGWDGDGDWLICKVDEQGFTE